MPPPPPSLASSSVSEASSMTQTNPKKTIANSISGLSIRSKAKKALGLGGKEVRRMWGGVGGRGGRGG